MERWGAFFDPRLPESFCAPPRCLRRPSLSLDVRQVRQAFAASQTDSAFGADEMSLVKEQNFNHLQLMSYPELIEGVARLGALKFEDDSIPMVGKISGAIEMILRVQQDRNTACGRARNALHGSGKIAQKFENDYKEPGLFPAIQPAMIARR